MVEHIFSCPGPQPFSACSVIPVTSYMHLYCEQQHTGIAKELKFGLSMSPQAQHLLGNRLMTP